MILTTEITSFIQKIEKSIEADTFAKLTLSKMVGAEEGLKNVYVRLIELKNEAQFSFTFRYETKDEVKNHRLKEGIGIISLWLGTTFLNANLMTTEADYNLVFNKKRKAKLLVKKASIQEIPSKSHDRKKNRQVSVEGNLYLRELGILSQEGKIRKDGQRKFKQINKYIEILSGLIEETFEKEELTVLDVGSGKGYLTFALYDYLKNTLRKKPQIAGIELRKNLVDLTNDLAEKCQFDQLQFFAKDINDYEVKNLDVLIALHACDIATDIAIAKGIQSNAALIVVAPCCHKQIRKTMNAQSELNPILKHGILEERQAEIITDGIRALLMEAHGYKTKVFEFISTEHTSKNLMIVGQKSKTNTAALEKIEAIKKSFGIKQHYLEKLLG